MAEYKLISAYDEAGNVRTFVFECNGAKWLAGQYQTWVLKQAGETEDENQRFFTIAAAPSEGELHISTRVGPSAFKQALNVLKPGEAIEAHDIEGDFTWEETGEPVVLVAGGIGVTPFRSILLERHALGKPLNATLLHYNREDAIPFKDEFAKLLLAHPELTIKYIVGEPITTDGILQNAPDARSQLTYLSGPEPMVDAVGEELKKQGVNLKQDWFPGYTDQTY